MKNEIAEDCIHLRACRRLAKIYKNNGSKFAPRHCNEACTAYMNADEIIDKATDVAKSLISDCEAGFSSDDLCVECWRYMDNAISGLFE